MVLWLSPSFYLFFYGAAVPVRKKYVFAESMVFPWHFYFIRGHSLVELTEQDDSAADIMVVLLISSFIVCTHLYCCIHSR